MKPTEKHYNLVSQREDDEEQGQPHYNGSGRPRLSTILLSSLCLILLISNSVLLVQKGSACSEKTLYAGLTRDTLIPWTQGGDFNSDDDTLTDRAWENLRIDVGTVALSDKYIKSVGLPRAQRFPWDDTKGIYEIDAFHNLHCLKKLHQSLIESRDGLPQSTPLRHSIHCLNALRLDVICNADDTPRYTGLDQPSRFSGLGQVRQCRDWNRLEAWAEEHTACFRYINSTDPNFDTLERYKFCPKDSPYREWVHAIFGDVD
ncbi:hypothetical protein MMC28_002062 [Mycoblastus sanguinarius]|nr:hypothetical protein [Mycoblastus sanguinarius]